MIINSRYRGKHSDIIKDPDTGVLKTGTRLGDYLRNLIFMTDNVEKPDAVLSDVSEFGIENARSKTSFFIPTSVGKVGAWYLEPVS